MLFEKLEGSGREVAQLIRKTFGGTLVNQVGLVLPVVEKDGFIEQYLYFSVNYFFFHCSPSQSFWHL